MGVREPYQLHGEQVQTTFLGQPLTINMNLLEATCDKCGMEILIPCLPDGLIFCESCNYKNLVMLMDGLLENS